MLSGKQKKPLRMKEVSERVSGRFQQILNKAFVRYYRHYGKAIFESKRITCDPGSEYEIHMVTRESDFLESMWCLKTFYHFSGLRPVLFIHDDGSLTSDNIRIFEEHFRGGRVILKQDADILARQALSKYEFCTKFRFSVFFESPMVIKLFDPVLFSRTKKILMFDSDILFFKRPHEIIDCMAAGKGCFMSDYQNSYAVKLPRLEQVFNIKIIERFNAGLTYLPVEKFYDFDLIEAFLKTAYENKIPITHRIEQTLWAVFATKHQDLFTRLPEHYQISRSPITEKTISHHFVNDGSRKNLYKHGLRHFKRTGFLKDFNNAS